MGRGGRRPDEVNREPRQRRERRIDADNFPAQTSPHGKEIRCETLSHAHADCLKT